jgi:hypothetical protein
MQAGQKIKTTNKLRALQPHGQQHQQVARRFQQHYLSVSMLYRKLLLGVF